MAEEHVRTEQFDEFVKRIEDRFDYVYQRFDSINQRLAGRKRHGDRICFTSTIASTT